MTLDRNPTDYHCEIEQAALEPSNLVPGIGPGPDKMLLGRLFSYPDAHRYRIGTNYKDCRSTRLTCPSGRTPRTATWVTTTPAIRCMCRTPRRVRMPIPRR